MFQANGYLLLRIAAGAGFFIVMALYDLRKNGRRATRWREYLILIIAVIAAMFYGVLNDQITSSISWEYYFYGKELELKLGPQVPPDPLRLHLAAAVVGIQATWTAGLVIGVAMLIANNPSKRLPQLSYGRLLRQIPLIYGITIFIAVLGAIAGYACLPTLWNEEFADMLRKDLMRPRRFMMVYGIHLGGYMGGGIGAIVAIVRIRRQRRSAPI